LGVIASVSRWPCLKNNKAGACGAGFVNFEGKSGSVANGHAGNVGALERFAHRFGGIAIETVEAGAV
jgi:hypothetical protein